MSTCFLSGTFTDTVTRSPLGSFIAASAALARWRYSTSVEDCRSMLCSFFISSSALLMYMTSRDIRF